MNAENLLHVMRPEVEGILELYGLMTPPSQKHRTLQCLDEWKEENSVPENIVALPERPPAWFDKSRRMRTLEDFLSVHRTVWILEGKPV